MSAPALDPMVPASVAVRARRRETADTVTLTVEPPPGGFRFAPGQFNMLWAFGVGEVAISISGDPARTDRIEHTVRAVGAVSGALRALKKGAAVGLRGPFGSAWPVEPARGRDVLVVAGGIGLAPLRPVVRHLLGNRGDYGRVAVLYGARTPADLLYGKELQRWRARLDADVRVTVDRADPAWRGHVGVVTRLLREVELDPARTVAMACGPEVMMRYVLRELRARGLGDDRVWISMERNMQCAVGHCGHCQLGPEFVCRDGPVFRLDRIAPLLAVREV